MVAQKLNRILLLNASFSILCAIDMLIFSQLIADYMGGFAPIYLQVIALGLIGFAVFVFWVSRQKNNRQLALSIVQMDRSWVVGSILMLIFANSWFSSAGLLIIGTIAVIVAGFGEKQNAYIKQLDQQQSSVA